MRHLNRPLRVFVSRGDSPRNGRHPPHYLVGDKVDQILRLDRASRRRQAVRVGWQIVQFIVSQIIQRNTQGPR